MTLSRIDGRRGFSMVEALIGISITTVAGAALLTSLSAAVQSSTYALHRTVARGLADQLLDEIAAARFPTASDSRPDDRSTRQNFDDLDDYHGWSTPPNSAPVDRRNQMLGTEGQWITLNGQTNYVGRLAPFQPDLDFVRTFARNVTVEAIEPDSADGWRAATAESPYRRVTVRVTQRFGRARPQTLVEVSRVFSYVPFAS